MSTHSKKMEEEDIVMDDHSEPKQPRLVIDHSTYPPLQHGNDLFVKWKQLQQTLPSDFTRLLDPTLDDHRRGDLFELEDPDEPSSSSPPEQQPPSSSSSSSSLMDSYAWAIPDTRALQICAAYQPLVEMGAGAGYWARLLRELYDVEIDTYDIHVGPETKAAGVFQQPFTFVDHGGPEELLHYSSKTTLLLIYPDDFEEEEDTPTTCSNGQSSSSSPMSVQALQNFQGDTLIHVGEWFGCTKTLSMEGQGTPNEPYPWGRSTSPEFQIMLTATFHKVLQVPLPNWGSVQNSLSVWKRTQTTILEDDRYAYVPPEEQLCSMVLVTPSTQHLVQPKNNNHINNNEEEEDTPPSKEDLDKTPKAT